LVRDDDEEDGSVTIVLTGWDVVIAVLDGGMGVVRPS
jgi:hypothetical protein